MAVLIILGIILKSLNRSYGLKVKFRYEDWDNENGGLDYFPINWDDLYDMLNLSELDASILRAYAL